MLGAIGQVAAVVRQSDFFHPNFVRLLIVSQCELVRSIAWMFACLPVCLSVCPSV